MPIALYAPRINNNDDFVSVNHIVPARGDAVRKGQVIAEVETDKSVLELEAEADGYVLEILCEVGETVSVGAVMLWIGSTPDEAVPETRTGQEEGQESTRRSAEPTAKARAMLAELGLDGDRVPAAGERLTVADIEAWVAQSRAAEPARAAGGAADGSGFPPPAAGSTVRWTAAEHGMAHTVRWHRDEAVPAYLEIEYDATPWNDHAAEYMRDRKLMMSPALGLLAHRLVALVAERPRLNATVVDGAKYVYDHVNLGFTVQAGDVLNLVVIQSADELDDWDFIQALGAIQRRAISHRLRPEDVAGATIAFSSMARWSVRRHTPVLPPWTALIVAHTAPSTSGKSVLGATYDHRVLGGADVAEALESLSQPPKG